MTFYRHLAYVLSSAILFLACNTKSPPGDNSNSRYDLLNPFVIKLPDGLAEISGIVYYPKDTSVFAIEDENGIFYKIYLNKNKEIKKWKFDKKHDYEDLVLKDSIFYVLISNGDIESLQFTGDTISSRKFLFPDASKKTNEFESLYYDQGFSSTQL